MLKAPLYRELPIPAGLPQWKLLDIERYRAKFVTDTYPKDGVLYWASNDRPVPPDIFRDALCEVGVAQIEADRQHTQAALAAYREARRNISPEQAAEEAFERRAAFGPGVEVVDIITGERHIS